MRSLTITIILIIIKFSTSVFSQSTPIIAPTIGSIFTGSSISLTASGASSYSWAPSTGLNNTNSVTVIANPTVTATKTITITVNPKPTSPTITVNNDQN